MNIKTPLYLCGMMGSGKSAAGKILAYKINYEFIDVDQVIEKSEKRPITQIFKAEGEAYFRKIEWETIRKITAGNDRRVVSLGGGSLQNQQIVDHIKLSGFLIFLNPPQSVLLERLRSTENRPMLNTVDTALDQRISDLLKKRRFFYEQAHITVHTNRETPNETAEKIIKEIEAL